MTVLYSRRISRIARRHSRLALYMGCLADSAGPCSRPFPQAQGVSRAANGFESRARTRRPCCFGLPRDAGLLAPSQISRTASGRRGRLPSSYTESKLFGQGAELWSPEQWSLRTTTLQANATLGVCIVASLFWRNCWWAAQRTRVLPFSHSSTSSTGSRSVRQRAAAFGCRPPAPRPPRCPPRHGLSSLRLRASSKRAELTRSLQSRCGHITFASKRIAR